MALTAAGCAPTIAVASLPPLVSSPLLSGFASSFALVVASEVGDKAIPVSPSHSTRPPPLLLPPAPLCIRPSIDPLKTIHPPPLPPHPHLLKQTFFIAALLAAEHGRRIAFVGSVAALGAMSLISVGLGAAFASAAPVDAIAGSSRAAELAGSALLVFFGARALWGALGPGSGFVWKGLGGLGRFWGGGGGAGAGAGGRSAPSAARSASSLGPFSLGNRPAAPVAENEDSEMVAAAADVAALRARRAALPLAERPGVLAEIFGLVFVGEWGASLGSRVSPHLPLRASPLSWLPSSPSPPPAPATAVPLPVPLPPNPPPPETPRSPTPPLPLVHTPQDRSMLATVALGAASAGAAGGAAGAGAWTGPAGVVLGACTGHAAATGLAVAGGAMASERLGARAIEVVGGCLFLLFGGLGAAGVM